MSQVVETVIAVNSGNSADTLKGLREEAKLYREQMNSAKVSSDEFGEAQSKLNDTLAQIKNVLTLGTKEIKDAEGSYDSMVRTMSELTKAWRATGDEARRAQLGEEILKINTRLKELDASRGNFQRNVGNYSSAFQGLSGSMQQVLRELSSLQMGMSTFVLAISNNLPILFDNIARVNQELDAMRAKGESAPSTIGTIVKSLVSWQTGLMAVILVVQLLVKNWDKISSLWRDDTPQERAKKAIEAMNEAIEKQQNLLREQNTEALRQYTAELRNVGGDADKAQAALERYNEALRNNANTQAEANRATASNRLSMLKREQIEAETRLKELEKSMQAVAGTGAVIWYVDDIKAAKQAVEDVTKAYDEAYNDLLKYDAEVAKAENAIVKAQVDADIKRVESARKASQDIQDTYKELHEVAYNEFDTMLIELDQYIDEEFATYNPMDIVQKVIDQDLAQAEAELDALIKIEEDFTKALKVEADKRKATEDEEAEEARQRKEARVAMTADMMGNIASIFEENTVAFKAFATAEAIINTYQAATKSLAELGMPWGAVAAASALATGFAQVKNIMAVDTSGKSTSNIAGPAPAIVSAPAVVQEVPITRTTIDRDQEARLNAKLADQRVYIVYSDIEDAGKQVQVQRSESSF